MTETIQVIGMQPQPLTTGPAPARSDSGFSLQKLSEVQRQQLAASLTAEERRVLLEHGTERPFCGGLLDNKLQGAYVCRLCALPLFASQAKFDSGTGWPSFFAPYDPHHIRYLHDHSHGMVRIEIRCQRCDSHLGHVFPDGPQPTGWRYCLNSVAMRFRGSAEPLDDAADLAAI